MNYPNAVSPRPAYDPPEAVRKSQIITRIDDISGLLDESDKLDALVEERVRGVLTPSYPQEKVGDKAEAISAVPLVADLDVIIMRLRRHNSKLRDIADRVEL